MMSIKQHLARRIGWVILAVLLFLMLAFFQYKSSRKDNELAGQEKNSMNLEEFPVARGSRNDTALPSQFGGSIRALTMDQDGNPVSDCRWKITSIAHVNRSYTGVSTDQGLISVILADDDNYEIRLECLGYAVPNSTQFAISKGAHLDLGTFTLFRNSLPLKVIDEFGNGIGGARIQRFKFPDKTNKVTTIIDRLAAYGRNLEVAEYVESDGDGFFWLETGNCAKSYIVISHEDYETNFQFPSLPNGRLMADRTILLKSARPKTYRVVDKLSNPISGAQILVETSIRSLRRDETFESSHWESLQSSPDGFAQISTSNIGPQRLYIAKSGFATRRIVPNRSSEEVIVLHEGRDVEIRFHPTSGLVISRPIRFLLSTPLPADSWNVGVSDESGRAVVSCVPVSDHVYLSLIDDEFCIANPSGSASSARGFEYSIVGSEVTLNVFLEKTVEVRGRLMELEENGPVAEIDVELCAKAALTGMTLTPNQRFRARTGRNGEFRFQHVHRDTYFLRVISNEWHRSASIAEVSRSRGIESFFDRVDIKNESVDDLVVFVKRSKSVSGVVQHNRVPLESVRVIPRLQSEDPRNQVSTAAGEAFLFSTTDSQGRFLIRGVPDDIQSFQLIRDGFETMEISTEQADGSDSAVFELSRARPRTVQVRFTDSEEQPVSGISLSLRLGAPSESFPTSLVTDHNGVAEFTFFDQPATVQIDPSSIPRGLALASSEQLSWKITSVDSDFSVRLSPIYGVKGVVIDKEGQALDEHFIFFRRVSDEGEEELSLQTNSKGGFEIRSLKPSRFFILRTQPSVKSLNRSSFDSFVGGEILATFRGFGSEMRIVAEYR